MPSLTRRWYWAAFVAVLSIGAPAVRAQSPPPAPTPEPALVPQRLFASVLERFRSHRPPPFVTYTLRRSQLTAEGRPDVEESYTRRFWVRTSDRAALSRVVLSPTERGPLAFDRPAFNEARDPGPPTYDFFAGVDVSTYVAESAKIEGPVILVVLRPARSPERNRLRAVVADKDTYELRKLVLLDTLFIERGPTFPLTMTITMSALDGVPVIRSVHGAVGGNFHGDGQEVDYTFSDIAFPATLPDWYFDPRQYGAHSADAPV